MENSSSKFTLISWRSLSVIISATLIVSDLPSQDFENNMSQGARGQSIRNMATGTSNDMLQASGYSTSFVQEQKVNDWGDHSTEGKKALGPDEVRTKDKYEVGSSEVEEEPDPLVKKEPVGIEDSETLEPDDRRVLKGVYPTNSVENEEESNSWGVKTQADKRNVNVVKDEEAPESGETAKQASPAENEDSPEPGEIKIKHSKKKEPSVLAGDEEAPEPGEKQEGQIGPEADEEAPEPKEKVTKNSKKNVGEEGEGENGEGENGKSEADEEAPEPKEKVTKNSKKNVGEEEEGGNGEGEKDEDSMITKYVDFGGALEVEAFYSSFDKDTKRSFSDIVLEAAELDFEIKLVDWATGLLSIEWEPDDSRERRTLGERIVIKEGFITLGATEKCPPYVRTGRLFVPFTIATGAVVGDTLSVSDPLTIEIFETREDVIMVGTSWKQFQIAAYVFNGETHRSRFHFTDPCLEEDPNDPELFDDVGHIQQFGATIRYGWEKPDDSFSLGLDFISDVFDSDNLSDAFPEALFASNYSPGIAAHIRYFKNGISFIAEIDITCNKTTFFIERDKKRFEYGECISRFKRLKLSPMAWMIEIGYVTTICKKKTYFAIDYSQSYDLYGEFPKHRLLASVGCWLYEDKVLLAAEYGHDIDYRKSQGGSGRSVNRFMAQLAYEW